MFRGSVQADLRSIIHEQSAGWPQGSAVHVGCSGNFTIERTLAGRGFQLHSNDVQLYSSAVGAYLAGFPLPITLRPEAEEHLGWIRPFMDSPEGTLAVVMLGTRFFQWVGKAADHPYYGRMLAAYRDQFPGMHAKTVEKIRGVDLRLASYHPMDVREWLQRVVPPDGAVATFPPFFAGDYESQFAPLDKWLDWPEPEYPTLDEEGKDELVQLIVDRPRWILGLHRRRDQLAPYLRGMVQTTNRGVPIYVYADGGHTRIVQPRQPLEHVRAPRLGPGDEVGGRMTIAPLTGGQFSTLRSQYMNHNIRPGSPLLALAVVVDGMVCGAFALSPPKYDPACGYLLSDFPVAPTSYRHLAKLVVLAALSAESRALLERSLSRRIRSLATTAFTQRPVSMKYRGIMRLTKRAESEDPLYAFQLQYEAPMGGWTLAEALAMWRRKHSARVEAAA
jgi:hypothetical protein